MPIPAHPLLAFGPGGQVVLDVLFKAAGCSAFLRALNFARASFPPRTSQRTVPQACVAQLHEAGRGGFGGGGGGGGVGEGV